MVVYYLTHLLLTKYKQNSISLRDTTAAANTVAVAVATASVTTVANASVTTVATASVTTVATASVTTVATDSVTTVATDNTTYPAHKRLGNVSCNENSMIQRSL